MTGNVNGEGRPVQEKAMINERPVGRREIAQARPVATG